ncbi:MAG: hypothetical protein LC774_04240, partial [Acidobacteria bacterium]|nr:hypothetical protein [Acidobacteriota bacterium]
FGIGLNSCAKAAVEAATASSAAVKILLMVLTPYRVVRFSKFRLGVGARQWSKSALEIRNPSPPVSAPARLKNVAAPRPPVYNPCPSSLSRKGFSRASPVVSDGKPTRSDSSRSLESHQSFFRKLFGRV